MSKTRGNTFIENVPVNLGVYQLCLSNHIILQVRYIPSKRNVLADVLSRTKPLVKEWQLYYKVFLTLQNLVPTLTIDLIATRENFKNVSIPVTIPDQFALGVDVLTFSWILPRILYGFPPPAILPAVLTMFRKDKSIVLLIAPAWPKRSWYTDLLDLSVTDVLRLPGLPDLLVQSSCLHPNPELFHLHAWMFLGITLSLGDIQNKLPNTCCKC